MNTYESEAASRWGDTAAWLEYEKCSGSQSPAEQKATADGLMALFARLGELKELPPESDEAQAAVAAIRQYISDHYYECTDEIFAGLGEMYVADERFKANIDAAGGDGTAEFARDAIRVWCKRSR
ncbi:MAG: TipAS antibiotic-recognition domain-containing protein [Clostridia bacterium]|nr:TipAS antibiotic-recognition domain-containing protein [Clostridia bacterium]